ncbi:Protein kinase C [Temnothorax longispinosus]|uniref:Protein kinase C n=1 Tax=Temnothorax longispinosus TaxID=300112 RepID=A0A4S2JFJ0_9HYME|nr:Protein kinase C [Temnothorax longispinosus]
MPTQTAENDDIRVKIKYNGDVHIMYITPGITVDALREELRTICSFGTEQFTMKWVDDEGDPCRIASQQELDEALRLYELEKDTEIIIHESAPG